jgi:hypothetical protein
VPIVNKAGKIIGVTQVLNKRGGPFSAEDESRLRALHRANLDRAGKRQAVRRRPADQELQRGHAGVHVQRRDYAGWAGEDRHLQRGRAAHPAHQRRRHCRPPAGEFFGGANTWIWTGCGGWKSTNRPSI